MQQTVYDFSARMVDGSNKEMGDYRGKVLLIVNTASKCGFTPQYSELQTLYDEHRERGFEVLAFPCNQFGGQEPGDGEEIENFCRVNYKTTFTLFSKVEVNGKYADPLFKFLKTHRRGLLGTKAIKWNFTKFLVGKRGQVVKRYAPATPPTKIEKDVARLLAADEE